MSNQSGILADQKLLDILSNDLSKGQTTFITAKISEDSTKVELDNEYSTLEQCTKGLGDSPLYIFYLGTASKQYQFFSYVPDASPVRAKMLYASTKNTMVRQIGGNSIGRQLLITESDELAESVNSDNGDDQKSNVLTESERSAQEIDAAQKKEFYSTYNSISGRELVSQTGGGPSVLQFDVRMNDDIKNLLENDNVIAFKIDPSTEEVAICNKGAANDPKGLTFITEHPTYTIYKNGELYYFIYSCPSGSKVKERMLYASNKSGFIKFLQEKQGMEFTKTFEIGDSDELEVSLISYGSKKQLDDDAAAEASKNTTQKFSRPKGPGGRRARG
ncbi:Twinfilin-1 [Nakaseomyces bracarensis]|uniref:Twinfilin-1 n=1 Tax=Nakaseomyces bracarensis TaxID=273131 RepID=A0ABR4NWF8_9SACH